MSKETDLVKELRDVYLYDTQEWEPIREHGDRCMRALDGDLWDPKDRDDREKAGRPVLSPDELSQYVNQLVNDLRSNKRGIQATPQGNGANDKTAALHQGIMRQIEYESNAQQSGYIVMAENAIQRGYGFARIKAEYVSDKSFEQRLRLEPLPDPNLVTIDSGILYTSGKDMKRAFIEEWRAEKDFARDFPDAEIRSFNAEIRKKAGGWNKGGRVRIAEAWRIEPERRRLVKLKPPPPRPNEPEDEPIDVYWQDLEQFVKDGTLKALPGSDEILQSRMVDVPRVRQYLTNGLEILRPAGQKERFVEWPGRSIPVMVCLGKVLYIREAGETKRKIHSLISLALDPAMMHAYIASTEAELVGMTPKTPYVGYKGQFRGLEDDWASIFDAPRAYIEAQPTTEKTAATVLPLPQRQAYEPPIQEFEIAREAWRRAIQAAIGISPLPTSAQRLNEKSGKALERIDSQQQKGSYHFVDHYNEAITRGAQMLEELLPYFYDTARDVTVRKPDDTAEVVRINDPRLGQAKHQPVLADHAHDITLSTGPSFDSQREAASDFADSLAQNQHVFPLIADLVVKLKNLGPEGDAIAERLTPPQFQKKPGMEDVPPQIRAMLGQKDQQIQQLTEAASKMAEEIRTEQVKIQGAKDIKQMELQAKGQDADKDREVKLAVAELGAKVTRLQLFIEERARLGEQAADSAAADTANAHDVGMAVLDHQQTLDQNAQTHAQGLEAADQANDHAVTQTAAAAAAQPADEGAE